jgi:hypothetical protein
LERRWRLPHMGFPAERGWAWCCVLTVNVGARQGGPARLGPECLPRSQSRTLSGLARDRASAVAERSGRAQWPAAADRDRGAAPLPRRRPRGGAVSAHRRPSPLCPEIQAAPDVQAAGLPVAGADPKPRWTLRRLVGLVRARFARPCCRETVRAALHRLGLSWKPVVEEGQETARPCRSRAAGGLCRAVAPGIGRRPTRPASTGLSR